MLITFDRKRSKKMMIRYNLFETVADVEANRIEKGCTLFDNFPCFIREFKHEDEALEMLKSYSSYVDKKRNCIYTVHEFHVEKNYYKVVDGEEEYLSSEGIIALSDGLEEICERLNREHIIDVGNYELYRYKDLAILSRISDYSLKMSDDAFERLVAKCKQYEITEDKNILKEIEQLFGVI